jgi:pimeloyl-[acyl-carrier protein] methyl ester esterase
MMHVEVRGTGAPLVLLHGWAMHGGIFEPLAARLCERFELHIVDLPGHGHSRESTTSLALEDVVEMLVARVPRAPWVGWSLGGLFALHAAATRPDAVDGLVMLCASPRFVRADDDWPSGMPADTFREFATGLRTDYRGTLERFVALEAFGSDDARDELRTLRDALFARGEPSPTALADGLALLERSDLRHAVAALRVPSLWLSGRRDRVVDPRAMAAAAALSPDARHLRLDHAAHAPFLNRADAVAAAISDFTAGFRGTAASA